MKSKHLLLLMLLAVFAPWAANAQNQLNEGFESTTFPPEDWTAIHVSGSNSWARNTAYNHTTSGAASAYMAYAYSGHENYLVTPKLMPNSGEALSFYATSQSYPGTTLTIEVSTTTPTAAAFTTTLATYTTGSSSSNYIGTNSLGTWVELTIPATALTAYVGQPIYIAFHVVDNNGSHLYLDDITGVTKYVSSTPEPKNLTPSNITHEGATLSWQAPSNATPSSYLYNYKKSADANWGPEGMVNNGTSVDITGLNALTEYQFRVKADYGTTGQSDYIETSFTTTNVATAVGDAWSDDFEGTSCGWELINGTLTNQWVWGTAVNNGGTHALYVSNDGGATNNYNANNTKIFATKLLSFTEGKYEFSYDWLCKGESTWDFLRVALVPASETLTAGTDYATITQPNLPTGWIALDGGKLNLQETWQSNEVAVNVAAGNYYLVLAWRNDSGAYPPAASVDNVSIMRVACGYDVTDLAAGNITTSSADITWTAGEATGWQVAYKTNAASEWTENQPVSMNSTTLSGLAASTNYQVKVRAYCGGQDYGSWCDPITFATACDVITDFPWSENFEGMTDNTVPMCWDNSASTSSDITSYPHYLWGVYSLSGNKVIRMYNLYAHTGTAVINSPTITLPAEGTYELTFDYAHNASCGAFKVNISEDGGTTFTEKGSYASTGSATLTEATPISLAEYAGKSIIVQFLANANYGSGAIYVDNIGIDVPPTCIKPSALKCDSKTAHTATLSWTNGEEGQNAWQIAYSTTSDFNPDEVTPVDVTTNPATIDGLSQSTTYYAYVRANCGSEDGVSAWCNNKLTFTTLAGNVTPTGLAVAPASITSSQATASWNAVAGNTLHESYDIYWDLATTTSVPAEPAAPNLITDITATSQDITGLNPESSYKVWVRDNCGTDGYSSWSSAVTFSTVSACQTPDGLAESNVTNNSATITWNTYGLTDFNLRYSTDGTTWTTVENVNSPYTFPNNLTANTAYQVQVQAACADAETWSTVLNFRTECAPMTITETEYINEGFEDYTGTGYSVAGVVPYCWDNYTTGTYPAPHVVTSGSYAYVHTDTKSLNFEGSANSSSYAALPEFTNDFSTLMVNFWMQTESATDGKLSLGYITTEDNNYNTYQVIEEYDNTTTMAERTTYLGSKNVPATAARLVFRWIYTGSSYYACCIDDVVVKLAPSCYPVGTLTAATDVTATSAKLSWALVDDTQDAWQVCLNGDESNLIAATTHENFLLEGLTPETAYTVKVRANCGDSQGEWSNEVSFTTLEACPAPSGLAASNLTQNTADLTWTGESDSYNVKYWIPEGMNELYFEGFEDPNTFSNWTRSSNVNRSTNAKHNGSNGVQFTYTTNPPLYLISPDVSAYTSESGLKLEFYYSNNSTSYTETFYVGFSSTDTEYESFDFGDTEYSVTNQEWKRYYEDIPTGTKYFAIKYTGYNTYNMYVDDFTIGKAYPASEPQTITSNTTNAQLSNLTAGTEYEVQVQGVCDNVPGNWCDAITFTTMAEGNKVFTNATTDGKWGTASNWVPAGAPALTDEVIIRANATIDGDAAAKKITFEGSPTPTLTIADGGKLMTDNNVTATVKKNVASYGESTNGGYVLLTSPIGESSFASYSPVTAGLITANEGDEYTYDLYEWLANPSDDNEWRNYRKNDFSLYHGEGYLYANKNDVELTFTGIVQANNVDVEKTGLDYGTEHFQAWNLYGNPFMCDAYLNDATSADMAFYRMNTNGDGFTVATGAIRPMEGVFVQTSAASQGFKFSRTQTETSRALLNVNLTKVTMRVVEGSSDNAIIRFDQGGTLEKFSFREDASKVYIPQDNIDYAVVSAEAMGELPVNFRANENGSYTLSFTSEEVSFSYLHLIDNMTGNDVDLLQTPSYTFDALTTDYESRFKLVFATGNAADDSFAFYSNGNWIINNDGQATLQVIDVTGRILSSETVNGSVSTTINAAPGVYMLRLVNGDNVKVQKVVVR